MALTMTDWREGEHRRNVAGAPHWTCPDGWADCVHAREAAPAFIAELDATRAALAEMRRERDETARAHESSAMGELFSRVELAELDATRQSLVETRAALAQAERRLMSQTDYSIHLQRLIEACAHGTPLREDSIAGAPFHAEKARLIVSALAASQASERAAREALRGMVFSSNSDRYANANAILAHAPGDYAALRAMLERFALDVESDADMNPAQWLAGRKQRAAVLVARLLEPTGDTPKAMPPAEARDGGAR